MVTPAGSTDHVVGFLHDTAFTDLPGHVVDFGRRCLLDLLGVAAAGRTTPLSGIIHDHAARFFAAGPEGPAAPIPFDGRQVGPPGAALAAGMTIDAIDAHDGHRLTKGHTGCHQLPALLAFTTAEGADDPVAFLTSLVVGYEVATRAGIALHATVPDFHTSGAWGAVGCAALGARILGLDRQTTLHALGIAEYHGPRSQMMRVIDHPTMLKDGSGWGAMAGVSAAYLAANGFTGAPALTLAAPAVADIWADLGEQWIIENQYFKPLPICRWAQPAVEAALVLQHEHGITSGDVERIDVATFHEAARLATAHPATTEEAQYSLPFPLAAALVRGRLGAAEITGPALTDPDIGALAARVHISEDSVHNDAFPGRRYARVTVTVRDGRTFTSTDTEARGDPEDHLTDDEIRTKFHGLADPVLGAERASAIEAAVDGLVDSDSLAPLLDAVLRPIRPPSERPVSC